MALNGTTNEQKIWNFLIAHGLTPCGAASLMDNIYAESGPLPNNLQNMGNTKLRGPECNSALFLMNSMVY